MFGTACAKAERMLAHYTAHAAGNLLPLTDDEVCRWLWERLRDAFPGALAAILMPDHLHMIAPLLEVARRRLAAILGACARRFRMGHTWARVPEPAPLATPDKVPRAVRYTHLNCSRPWKVRTRIVQLVPDPLMWRWSTLRDSIGAIADPWVPAERLASALGRPLRGLTEWLHGYVTADAHVDPEGTPFPRPAPASDVPVLALDAIARAAVSATRGVVADLRRQAAPARKAFAALALEQGWRPRDVAKVCGIDPRNVRRLAASCPPDWFGAAALCLGDERLTHELRQDGANPFLKLPYKRL